MLHSPHDDGDEPHDGVVETVEEVPEWLTLLLHATNDEAEAHGEDDEAKGVDAVHCAKNWDIVLITQLLAYTGTVHRTVHRHPHRHCPLPGLSLKLHTHREGGEGGQTDRQTNRYI